MKLNDYILKRCINRYGGSERKETVLMNWNGETDYFLLKIPDPIREKGRTLSYINNAISEYLGCKILKSMGFSVQDVVLGEYTNKNGKTYLTCACKNIIPDSCVLAEAANTSLGSDADSHAAERISFDTIEIIADTVSDVDKNQLIDWYYDLFVADALIGNTDRHNRNWGFITGANKTYIAPVYDCGSSLSPLLSDAEMTMDSAKREAKNVTTALSIGETHRSRYIDVFEAALVCQGKEKWADLLLQAMKRVVPRISISEISKIIDETECISDTRKQFYKEVLKIRYEQILLPVLQKSMNNTKEQNIEIEDIYNYYNRTFRLLKQLPLYHTQQICINQQAKEIYKSSPKYALVLDSLSHIAECVVTTRSNNTDTKENILRLCNQYHISPAELKSAFQHNEERYEMEEEEYER